MSNIIEPIGGCNGLPIQTAMQYAVAGYKVKRLMWDDKEQYVEYIEIDGFVDNNGHCYQPDLADYVSCDWYVAV